MKTMPIAMRPTGMQSGSASAIEGTAMNRHPPHPSSARRISASPSRPPTARSTRCRTSTSTVEQGRFRLLHRPVRLRQDHVPARHRRSGDSRPSGTITVNGMTPDEARRKRAYGYVFQAAGALSLAHDRRATSPLPLEIMGYSGGRAEGAHRAHARPRQPHRLRAGSIPGSSPAACSSAPRSPARWPSTPTCC